MSTRINPAKVRFNIEWKEDNLLPPELPLDHGKLLELFEKTMRPLDEAAGSILALEGVRVDEMVTVHHDYWNRRKRRVTLRVRNVDVFEVTTEIDFPNPDIHISSRWLHWPAPVGDGWDRQRYELLERLKYYRSCSPGTKVVCWACGGLAASPEMCGCDGVCTVEEAIAGLEGELEILSK